MEYELIKSKIKNIYIKIENGKVIVKAPYRVSKQEIDKIVAKKTWWISKKIKEQENREEPRNPNSEEIEMLKQKLETYVRVYSEKIGVCPNKIRIRNIKTAWGSCSKNKNITFAANLAFKSDEFVEYVVVHELCHIKHMNHSEKFWKLVESNILNYREIRREGR